ncbi:hypothetical protein PLICBS_008967 [Purpureocillium lilacinum]|uniref:uncharacterized protein n=1 Tax=Purpureocillium lilacinum TaxID=33203 RepID=UPI0020834C5B|nr:hypothetical protein PLICBS_008967 [Purpureocillium lilacinum]
MAGSNRLAPSRSSQQLPTHNAFLPQRLPPSTSSISLAFPYNASVHSLLAQGSRVRSSGTWTASSGELGLVSDTDEVDDRAVYVHEYNRLAKKHGVRPLIVQDFTAEQQGDAAKGPDKRGWLHRFLHPNPNRCSSSSAPTHLQPRHKKSASDLAHMLHSRREPPRLVDIQDMVRLSGKSVLYLPPEYAPCSLVLPTCIRATAQHLAQNATTRGLFRIPGSVRIVTALFDHYCYLAKDSDDIASTVRCANLPGHIPYAIHDVASTFKRLLSVLPGGILGSLALLDALVAIHSQLNGEPEFPRTKQTKVRARLIALAIGTVKSQFRRELICSVFGLLSLIGRAAEVTPREDKDGRPLPTGDLMGYTALGIVFGPLLVGDLLDQYNMKLAKMLVSNWRDIVRQMKSLGLHHRKNASSVNLRNGLLRPSASDFAIKMPQNMNEGKREANEEKGNGSPEPDTPTMGIVAQDEHGDSDADEGGEPGRRGVDQGGTPIKTKRRVNFHGQT